MKKKPKKKVERVGECLFWCRISTGGNTSFDLDSSIHTLYFFSYLFIVLVGIFRDGKCGGSDLHM